MIIKFDYNKFLIMDGEKLLSISHHFFPVFTCKNRIMLSVMAPQLPDGHADRSSDGDLIEFVDLDFTARVARVNAAAV